MTTCLLLAMAATGADVIIGNPLSTLPTTPGGGGADGDTGSVFIVDGWHNPEGTTPNFTIPEGGGVLTKATILNDTDTLEESVDLLVLRPLGGNGFTVIHRVTVTDDAVPSTTGTTDYQLANLPVLAGDVLGHWGLWNQPIPQQADYTGPANVQVVNLDSENFNIGNTINFAPFPQPRSYFWNVTMTPNDSDSDELVDSWERTFSDNLTDLNGKAAGPGPGAGTGDFDGDGLLDKDELTFGTDPSTVDTDKDGVSDGEEVGIGIFSVVDGVFAWEQARVDAVAKGGRLATFASSQEWQGALRAIRPDALAGRLGVWIGASDQVEEGTWRWATREPFTFTNWAEGEPDNGNDSDFAEVAGTDSGVIGKWYDRRSSTLRDGYILEKGNTSSPLKIDSDDDGLTDAEEKAAATHPLLADTDGDGLSDRQEVRLSQTSPLRVDTDDDGQEDGTEDPDADGLSNAQEILEFSTNPLLADTDGDGFSDTFELNSGFNATNPASTPDAVSTILPAVEFRFNAAQGVSYRIEGSNDLQNWVIIEPNLLGQGGGVTRLYSIENQPTRYLRVQRN